MTIVTNRGFTIWFTGLSGAGKTTIARLLEARLQSAGAEVELLDGDEIRTHLSRDLGYTREDRIENVRRIGYVSKALSRHGVIAIVAAISPFRATRAEVRLASGIFVEVYVRCPLEVLIQRDTKGLYRRALDGEVPNFTGISDPYEIPDSPDLTIDSSTESPSDSADRVWDMLVLRALIDRSDADRNPSP